MKKLIVMLISLVLLMNTSVFASDVDYSAVVDDEIQRTFVSINEIREGIPGLEAFEFSDILKEIALTHAKYMFYNTSLSSIEEEGLLYYRGKYPWDRADFFGYNKSFIYEFVKKDYANYMEVYRELLNDPDTRGIVLNPMYTDIGMNVHETYMTFELGGNSIDAYAEPIIYPYDGQVNVQPVWQGPILDRVNTDPNISVESSGLPITWTYYGEDIVSITNKKFEIIDLTSGEEVPYELIEPGIYHQLKNTVTLIPLQTLYGKEYQVSMVFDMKLEDESVIEVDEVFSYETTNLLMSTIVEQKFITRAEFVEEVISNDFLHIPLIEPIEIKFSDVDINSNSSIYINTASELGIINGYTDGSFGPTLNVTKNQVYTILIKTYESKYPRLDSNLTYSLEQFKDSDEIASWARMYLRKAGALGILLEDQGYLKPNDYLTVDELEEIMTIFNNKIEEQ